MLGDPVRGIRLVITKSLTAGVRVPVRDKLSCGKVFQLMFNASVILVIQANIMNCIHVRSSSTENGYKSPYEPEGVDATETQLRKLIMNRMTWGAF